MTLELSIKIETNPPPAPKRKPPPPPDKMHYPFEAIPIGGAARFPRAFKTVQERMYEFKRQPGNERMKFVIRPITKTACRVWRVA